MASNHMLTRIIKGRTLESLNHVPGILTIGFDDGSTMTVKIGDAAPTATPGGKIKAVRQQGTAFNLDFEDGSTLHIETADVASSVMLRDKNHVMEYAD